MTVPLNLVLVFWFLILDFKKAGRKKNPTDFSAGFGITEHYLD
jgi:hypothetical protein